LGLPCCVADYAAGSGFAVFEFLDDDGGEDFGAEMGSSEFGEVEFDGLGVEFAEEGLQACGMRRGEDVNGGGGARGRHDDERVEDVVVVVVVGCSVMRYDEIPQ
jgi:hypothetical protein